MPNYSELMKADLNQLAYDCEHIATNFTLDYNGHYRSRPLCDFEVDVKYNFATFTWIGTVLSIKSWFKTLEHCFVNEKNTWKTVELIVIWLICHGETQPATLQRPR